MKYRINHPFRNNLHVNLEIWHRICTYKYQVQPMRYTQTSRIKTYNHFTRHRPLKQKLFRQTELEHNANYSGYYPIKESIFRLRQR